MKLGFLIKIYCQLKNIGTREVAKEIGVSHTTISRIMNGKSTDIKTAVKLFNWLISEG